MEIESQPTITIERKSRGDWKKKLDDFLGQPNEVKGRGKKVLLYKWVEPNGGSYGLRLEVKKDRFWRKPWIDNLKFTESRDKHWSVKDYYRQDIDWVKFNEAERTVVFSGNDEEGSPAELKVFAPKK